jgi:hypothetical protein
MRKCLKERYRKPLLYTEAKIMKKRAELQVWKTNRVGLTIHKRGEV